MSLPCPFGGAFRRVLRYGVRAIDDGSTTPGVDAVISQKIATNRSWKAHLPITGAHLSTSWSKSLTCLPLSIATRLLGFEDPSVGLLRFLSFSTLSAILQVVNVQIDVICSPVGVENIRGYRRLTFFFFAGCCRPINGPVWLG